MILGGPTKHYDYSDNNILNIFNLFNDLVEKNDLQGIVIPSIRTPKNIIDLSKKKLNQKKIIIDTIDKKNYQTNKYLEKYIDITS